MKLRGRLFRLCAAAVGLGLLWFAGDIVIAYLRTPSLVSGPLKSAALTARDLSPWQLKALLAVEDPKFYEHDGIDLRTPGAGLTTITQGVAKKLYFKPFKPGIRKLRLMALAKWALSPRVSKDDQLTLFLNLLYYGRSQEGREVIGLADAARTYYGKAVADLSETEYCSLIAMHIAPENFHVLTHPEANRERTRRILKVVTGEYAPKGLMDQYYGPLPVETQPGLAPASYFPGIYRTKDRDEE